MAKSEFFKKIVQYSKDCNTQKKQANFKKITEEIEKEASCGHFELVEQMYFENIMKYREEGFKVESQDLDEDFPDEDKLYCCKISWGEAWKQIT